MISRHESTGDENEDLKDPESLEPTVAVNDATVVVNDATIVVNDATIAVNDSTVAVNDATVAVNDETVAVNVASASVLDSAQVSASAAVGLPVEEPGEKRMLADALRRGTGLDPERRIDPVPGAPPWEALPSGEVGVSQGMPVAYGARSNAVTDLQLGADEVQRKIGPAPVAEPVQIRPGREGLLSLRQHDKRRGLVTLLLYAAAVVVSVIGLIGVATLAFG